VLRGLTLFGLYGVPELLSGISLIDVGDALHVRTVAQGALIQQPSRAG
jgi:hypothetical protein